jgi:SAM-dependent methyltransferase
MPRTSPGTYAGWRATPLGHITEQLELELVLDLAGPLAGKRVLDVGTGDGTYAIAAAAQGAEVTGIDPSPDMLAAAAQRATDRGVELDLRPGVAEQLPVEDGSFDVVLAVTVLCFVGDPARAVREMARALAPGGRLVLADLGRWSTWAAWRRTKQVFGSTAWRGVRFWSRRELAALVEGAGLVVESARGAVCYPPWGRAATLMAGADAVLCRAMPSLAAFIAVAGRRIQLRRLAMDLE